MPAVYFKYGRVEVTAPRASLIKMSIWDQTSGKPVQISHRARVEMTLHGCNHLTQRTMLRNYTDSQVTCMIPASWSNRNLSCGYLMPDQT